MFEQRTEIRKILKRIMESVHNLDYEGVRDLLVRVFYTGNGWRSISAQVTDDVYL